MLSNHTVFDFGFSSRTALDGSGLQGVSGVSGSGFSLTRLAVDPLSEFLYWIQGGVPLCPFEVTCGGPLLTDSYVGKVNDILKAKETEILEV